MWCWRVSTIPAQEASSSWEERLARETSMASEVRPACASLATLGVEVVSISRR